MDSTSKRNVTEETPSGSLGVVVTTPLETKGGGRRRSGSATTAGQVTQTQSCRCGRLKRLVDGAGNITEWARDEAGRRNGSTDLS